MKQTKIISIVYWIATLWLALGMTVSGVLQILQVDQEVEAMMHLGYPLYFLPLLGVWKLLGVVAILSPRYALIKEWAYAGFFFTMSGAFVSHLAVGDSFGYTFPSILLMILIVVSWYTRPESKKVRV